MISYPAELWEALSNLLSSRRRGIIAIDGPAGSGKSTLAREIESRLLQSGSSATIVHMDDLYNGWDDALTESLASKLTEIANSHFNGEQLLLRTYDWLQSRYTEPTHSPSTDFLILEGVGSSQRAIRNWLSLNIWIESPSETGLARVLTREPGIDEARMREWQIREREHFLQDESKVAANIKIST